MIEIKRDGEKVFLLVRGNGVISTSFFEFHSNYCVYDYQARLLQENLSRGLQKNLERIREESYQQGWKDAKAKVAKKKWFPGIW